MIAAAAEYDAVRSQAYELYDWWERLEREADSVDPLTVSNIHRKLAMLHQEMGAFKVRPETKSTAATKTAAEYDSARRQAHESYDRWKRLEREAGSADPLAVSNIHRHLVKLHRVMGAFKARAVTESTAATDPD